MVSGKEIIIIACKLFALYLFIKLIQTIEFLITPVFDPQFFIETFIYYVFQATIQIGLILVLLWKSKQVADILMKNEKEINIALPISSQTVFQLAFVIVGTFIMIETIPYVLINTYNWLKLELREEFEYTFRTDNHNFFYSIIKLLFAFLLVKNSAYFSRLLSIEGMPAGQ